MKTLAERLIYALDASGKTKTDLWKACGISSGAVSHWFSGLSQIPSGENLTIVCKLLNINPHWLLTGEGEMHPTETDHLTMEILVMIEQMDAKERRIWIAQGMVLLNSR